MVCKINIAIILVIILFIFIEKKKKEHFEKANILGDITSAYGFIKGAVKAQMDKVKKEEKKKVKTPVAKVSPS